MTLLTHARFFAAAGAAQGEAAETGWVAKLIQELGRSQATEFLFALLQGTILGVLLGVIIAVGACYGFRRLGWYELPWRFARWVRWGSYCLTTVTCAIAIGAAGFWSGVIGGSDHVLRKSQLGTDVFPKIADAVADGMAWLQIRAGQSNDVAQAVMTLELDQFRAGHWELHAPNFLQHLDRFRDSTVKEYIVELEASALKRAPALRGSLGEKLLHELLHGFSALLIDKQLDRELEQWGVGRTYRVIRQQLIDEAARQGNSHTIARSELSAFIVREGMVPGILGPIRSFCRAQQFGCLSMASIAVILPATALRLAQRIRRPANPAPPSAAPNTP